MIVSLYFWGGVQRAEHCHGCYIPLQTWLILCSAMNRTICFWAASELISAKHHFLEDGEEMFPAGYKSVSREMNRVPAPASLGFCLHWRGWWQPFWISRGLWGELWWSSKVYEYSLKTQQPRKPSKVQSFIPLRRVLSLFAFSRGSQRQQTSICSSELLFAVSWTDADTVLREQSKALPRL